MKDCDYGVFFFKSKNCECFYRLRQRLPGKERLRIQERGDNWRVGFNLHTPGPGPAQLFTPSTQDVPLLQFLASVAPPRLCAVEGLLPHGPQG